MDKGNNELQCLFNGQHDQGEFGVAYLYLGKPVKTEVRTKMSHFWTYFRAIFVTL